MSVNIFLTNDSHVLKNKVGHLPPTTYENYLKMDQRPKCKLKLFDSEENSGVDFHDIGFG